jgi:hypothetical protein
MNFSKKFKILTQVEAKPNTSHSLTNRINTNQEWLKMLKTKKVTAESYKWL